MSAKSAVGQIATQIRGVSYNKADASVERRPGTIGIVRAGNIVDGELREGDLVFVPESKVNPRQLLRQGDVLIAASSGSLDVVGKAARVRCDQDLAFGAFCKVLRPDERVDPGYFAHFFQTATYRSHVARVAAGANINNLRNGDLDDIEIPLPPIEEQRRIALVLDAGVALRTRRSLVLRRLDTLVQSMLVELLGRDAPLTATLGELAEVQGGLQVTAKRQTLPIEAPYLRVANVQRGVLDLGEVKRMRVSAAELARTALQQDDLLVVEGHGNKDEIGRVARWDGSIDGCVHQNHLIRVRCGDAGVHPRVVEAFMNSWVGRRALLGAANTTSGLNTISTGDVRAVRVPVPEHGAQQRFVRAAERVELHRRAAQQHATHLDALLASLQQRAFAGEL